jgi:hypothetical protein
LILKHHVFVVPSENKFHTLTNNTQNKSLFIVIISILEGRYIAKTFLTK